MTIVAPVKTSFTGGELTPRMYGQFQLPRYLSAAKKLLNFKIQPQGPAERRGGTKYIAATKFPLKQARLIEFVFNESQAYVLEFGDQYVRFYRNRAQIISGTPVEVATPYLEADLKYIYTAQSKDVLYIACPGYAPRTLSRTSDTSWTLTTLSFTWGPFLGENTTATTITPSAVTGSITLTASAATFLPGHVGASWKLSEPAGFLNYSAWTPGEAVTVGVLRKFGNNVYEAQSNATTSNIAPLHDDGDVSDGTVVWRYLHSGAGYATITAYTSPTVVSATVVKRLPRAAATKYWAEGAWSPVQGYPAVVALFDQRVIWAATISRPLTMWFSKTGDFQNFDLGESLEDEAISYTIDADQQQRILWIKVRAVLIIGLPGGEFKCSASSQDNPITPTDIRVIQQTGYGSTSSYAIKPILIADKLLFVQRGGRKLREFAFDFSGQTYTAEDLAAVAEHITNARIKELAYQAEPDNVIWAVLQTGDLAALTYYRSEDVIAWTQHTLGGVSDGSGTPAKIESACVIPGSDGLDEPYLLSQRYINGSVVRYVELLTEPLRDDQAQAQAFYIDAGVTYSGAATSVLTGLSHLEGATVQVLVDGATHPDRVVSSGQITLDAPTVLAHVGLGYNSDLETLPQEEGARNGTAMGKYQKIVDARILVRRTLGLQVGTDFTALDQLPARSASDMMDTAPPLYTGFEDVTLNSVDELSATLCIRQSMPLPAIIQAVLPNVDIGY